MWKDQFLIKALAGFLGVILGLFLVFGSVCISRALSLEHPLLFNPQSGFALAVLLFGGMAYFLPLFLGSWVLNYLFFKYSILVSALLAFDEVLAMSVAVFLMKRLCSGRNPTLKPKDWFLFIGVIIPICLGIRSVFDAISLTILNPSYHLDWTSLYKNWIYTDAIGIIISVPFFLELSESFSQREKFKKLFHEIVPVLLGNGIIISLFLNGYLERLGWGDYFPRYLSLLVMIVVAYYVSPLGLSISILFQGLWTAWSWNGLFTGLISFQTLSLSDLRIFLGVLGIIVPILAIFFKNQNDEEFQKQFYLIRDELNLENIESNFIRIAFQSDSVGVALFDRSYRCLQCNQIYAKTLNLSVENVLGTSIEDRLGPNAKMIRKIYDQIVKTRKPIWNIKTEMRAWELRPVVDLYSNYIPVFFKDREVRGIILIITKNKVIDMNYGSVSGDENKINEPVLENRMFALAISHDLQEPIRSVSQSLEIINEKFKQGSDDSETSYFIENALNATKRIQGMVQGNLELSKLDRVKINESEIDAQELIQDCLRSYRDDFQGFKVRVSMDLIPRIKGDKILLSRVIQNLLSNSLKYKGESELSVVVSAKIEGRMCQFSFSDNGSGFDPKDAERIFMLYQRLHTYQERPGYGIGLAISKKIIELHGGKIWAESTLGEGATFHFTLPIALTS